MHKEITTIYEKPFMLTSQFEDPRDLDFTFYTHLRLTTDTEGNPTMKEYFMTYNPAGNTFSDLAVRCTYTNTVEGGIITKTVEDIEWFFTDGEVGETRQLVSVFE